MKWETWLPCILTCYPGAQPGSPKWEWCLQRSYFSVKQTSHQNRYKISVLTPWLWRSHVIYFENQCVVEKKSYKITYLHVEVVDVGTLSSDEMSGTAYCYASWNKAGNQGQTPGRRWNGKMQMLRKAEDRFKSEVKSSDTKWPYKET